MFPLVMVRFAVLPACPAALGERGKAAFGGWWGGRQCVRTSTLPSLMLVVQFFPPPQATAAAQFPSNYLGQGFSLKAQIGR